MITTATLIQHFKPMDAVFCKAGYNAFRQNIDANVGQRKIRTYQLRGALLLADENHQVMGKIEAATVDDWGMAQDASYHLPVEATKISLVQRIYLRGRETVSRRVRQPGHGALKQRKRNAASNKPHTSCERRAVSYAVKWTSLRLAG
ncbi:MAG: hypothetical protein HKO84_06670 [Pseudomonadales bacterium]|nr:hypothetical protein [Pseudomonadales bacterium]